MKQIVGYTGATQHDLGKSDGTPGKLMDSSRIAALGWRPRITLAEGLAKTYAWYLQHRGEKG